MRIQGEHRFAAPRQAVWDAVLDPEMIARTLPGCQQLEQIGEGQYRGLLQIQVGPVQGQFDGTVTLSQLVPPESYHLDIKGKGTPGFLNGKGQIRLEADGDAATRLCYDVDASVGGRIASVGQRLLDSSARVVARQTLEALAAQVEQHLAGQAAVAAPSQAEFARQVTRGVVADLVPPARRPWLIGGAVLLLALLLWWLLS